MEKKFIPEFEPSEAMRFGVFNSLRNKPNDFFNWLESVLDEKLSDDVKIQIEQLLNLLSENATLYDFLKARKKQEEELIVRERNKFHDLLLRKRH